MRQGWIRSNPTPKQLDFLLEPERESLYGGAAGGGKSEALLMIALQYIDVPGHAAMIFRRTYRDLALPGAMMDRAHEWLGPTSAHWSDTDKRWTFPSGATLSFGYLDGPRDHFRYQGAELQTICFDELTQLREEQYTYMFSRLRRLQDSDVPLRVRSSSNPGGVGHDWVARRFGLGEYGTNAPMSTVRPFHAASLDDNPYLDRDSYRETLMTLDPVTREQLLNGDWSIRPAGTMFKLGWFVFTTERPKRAKWVRFWDRAATEAKAGKDPDYTCGALVAEAEGIYYVSDIQRFRESPRENEIRIRATAEMDGVEVPIRMEHEGGAGGKDMIDTYARRVLIGYDFRGDRPSGSKVERAAIVASAAEQGNVHIVRGHWNTAYIGEATAFPSEGVHDDQVDAVSGAVRFLSSQNEGRAGGLSYSAIPGR